LQNIKTDKRIYCNRGRVAIIEMLRNSSHWKRKGTNIVFVVAYGGGPIITKPKAMTRAVTINLKYHGR
jgi:hypothetical protein